MLLWEWAFQINLTTQYDRKHYQASHKWAVKTRGGGGGGEVGYWSRRDVQRLTQVKKHECAASRRAADSTEMTYLNTLTNPIQSCVCVCVRFRKDSLCFHMTNANTFSKWSIILHTQSYTQQGYKLNTHELRHKLSFPCHKAVK